MKNEKVSYALFLVASICFYISAIICFVSKNNNNSIGIMNLCLGSTFLCLASVHNNKGK